MAILYRYETWVMTPHIGRVLGGFHHRLACSLPGGKPQIGREAVWTCPLLEDAMAEAVLQEVETYISRRQNAFTQFIATRPIIDLCLAAERRTGPRVYKWW